MNKKYYIYAHPSVYVVLEHSFGTIDAKVHGVYSTRESAEGKKKKLQEKGANGYLSILKKPVEGVKIKYKDAGAWGIVID